MIRLQPSLQRTNHKKNRKDISSNSEQNSDSMHAPRVPFASLKIVQQLLRITGSLQGYLVQEDLSSQSFTLSLSHSSACSAAQGLSQGTCRNGLDLVRSFDLTISLSLSISLSTWFMSNTDLHEKVGSSPN